MHLTYYNNIAYVVIVLYLVNVISTNDDVFKISKLNLIWTKAQHSLGASKLKDLRSDLARHETDELTLKKMKANNQDKDGLFEANIRKKLLLIMTQYKLDRYYDDIHPAISEEHENKREHLAKVNSADMSDSVLKSTFRDKRLDKLWKKAEQSGFSQEELMVLHEEFQHHQDRLDEHYDTMNRIDQEIEQRSQKSSKDNNRIDITREETRNTRGFSNNINESPSEKKDRLDRNIHQGLKENYRDIKAGIKKLHKKIVDKKVDDSQGPFQEQLVNNLWIAAIEAKFTAFELESLKEELGHYETRLKKLKHFENELEKNKLVSKNSETYGEESDEAKHIKKRVDELTYKVQKSHKAIDAMIAAKRSEL